jgi:hypothetical protein
LHQALIADITVSPLVEKETKVALIKTTADAICIAFRAKNRNTIPVKIKVFKIL